MTPGTVTSVVHDLMAEAGRSDYPDAPSTAARGPAGSTAGRRLRATAVAMIGLAAAGFVLAVAVLQTRTVAPAAERQRAELVSRAQALSADVTAQEQSVVALQAQVSALQAQALASSPAGRDAAARLAALSWAAGYVAVHGPGVVVTLSDGPARPDGTGAVQDQDLQGVVNGLWAAGAEAVGINGQRLTSATAIRAAGRAILVNYRPLRPPYVVTAIGAPDTLRTRFLNGDEGSTLKDLGTQFGVRWDVSSVDPVQVPAATAPLPTTAKVTGTTP